MRRSIVYRAEVFQPSVGICESIEKMRNDMTANKRALIVGGVAGGASCAARLRRLDEQVEIVLLDRGPYVSFANCGLPYYVGDVIHEEAKLLVATPELFRKRFNIEVRTQSARILRLPSADATRI